VASVESKAKIGAKEFTALLTLIVATHLFLNYPASVSRSALEAAWMEPILSGVVALSVFLWIEYILRKHYPGMDLIEIVRNRFGGFAAGLISIVFASYFLVLTARIMRQFMETVITTVLPSTPITVVGGLLILTVGFVATTGLEGIARISYMALPVLFLGVLALSLLTLNWWDTSLIFPFWGTGITHIGYGALQSSSIFDNVLVLAIIYPHAHDPKALRMVGVKSTIYTIFLLTLFILSYHMVFSPEDTERLTSPIYSMARIIHIGRFVQRLESIFIFMWVSAGIVKLSLSLWASAYLLANGFNWGIYRPIVPALGLLCLSLSMLPHDIATTFRIDAAFKTQWEWVLVLILPLALLLASRLGAKRSANGV
jgi:spore germination protein KB